MPKASIDGNAPHEKPTGDVRRLLEQMNEIAEEQGGRPYTNVTDLTEVIVDEEEVGAVIQRLLDERWIKEPIEKENGTYARITFKAQRLLEETTPERG